MKFCFQDSLKNKFIKLQTQVEKEIAPIIDRINHISQSNHRKVLKAFQDVRVSDYHFYGSTGYGYNDLGRDTLEELYANVFGAEDALVRNQITCGTHAIYTALFSVLRPGDEILFVTGKPYDTLQRFLEPFFPGSLAEWGIRSNVLDLTSGEYPDFDALANALTPKTRMVGIQRSCGYQRRPAVNIQTIGALIRAIKSYNENIICFVDNCYGEFVEEKEPPEVGADLTAGSLIKNPGGGLADGGGYLVGKSQLIKSAARYLTAPGLGKGVGSTPGGHRLIYQGLFMAPLIVAEALKGAVFAARYMQHLGFKVSPEYDAHRADLVQRIEIGSSKGILAFCKGIQNGSPVDAHFRPEPSKLPGYNDELVMAAGTFVQGSSIELSADAPLCPPYDVFLQGGLSQEYVKLALLKAVEMLYQEHLLPKFPASSKDYEQGGGA